MALVVEDGTAKTNAESYISVSDADAYHTARGASAWTGETAAKEAALRVGTAFIDGYYRGRWRGVRKTRDQALAWPRSHVRDEDGWDVDAGTIPDVLKQAVAEAALLSIGGTDLTPALERGGAIVEEQVRVGPISESKTYRTTAQARTTFTRIDDLLRGLTQRSGSTGYLQRA